jgi:hypothetical protein
MLAEAAGSAGAAGGCGRAKASTEMPMTDTVAAHTATATAAGPRRPPAPRQLSRLIVGQNRADQTDPARRTARRR